MQCQTPCMAPFSSPFPFSGISSISSWGEVWQFFHLCPGCAQPGVNEKKPKRNKKRKSWLHGAALGTARIMGQGWAWQLAERSAGTCPGLIQMKVLGNVWPSARTWLLRVSVSAQGFILGARLAVWALLGAVPLRGSGTAQTDHSAGDCSTNNGLTAAASDFLLLLLNFITKNETNPHFSLPLAYQVLWFLSPLPLKWCSFHFTVLL